MFSLTLLMTLVLPIICCLWYGLKQKKYRPIWAGVISFALSQVLLRLPLLHFLSKSDFYKGFSLEYPLLTLAFAAFSAGIFEEIGRYFVMQRFSKKVPLEKAAINYKDDAAYALGFGLGHGTLESLILSIPVIIVFVLNNFTKNSLSQNLGLLTWAIGGIERVLAIICHICLSVLVLRAIREKRSFWLFMSILIHGTINFIPLYYLSIIGNNLLNKKGTIVMELIFALLTLALVAYTLIYLRGQINSNKNQNISLDPDENGGKKECQVPTKA